MDAHLEVVDPSTGDVVARTRCHTSAEASARIAGARAAFEDWSRRPFAERAVALRSIADRLEREADALAAGMAVEVGKPVTAGRAEVLKCAWVCRHYAEHAESMLADRSVDVGGPDAFVALRPLGVVLAIMPWNFPYWQVFRFAAPALMAGNAAVLKHAPNAPGCALAIERLCVEAGLPDGLFPAVLVHDADAGALIDHPDIAAVTLTGSTRAGREVAARAGRALKKVVLELGGSDPYLVLDDADPVRAADVCAASRLVNGGQSCIAAKRFLVHGAVYDAFVARFTERMAAARLGDPRDPTTELGPLARVDLRDALHAQVQRSIAAGARLVLGGRVPERPGAWYPPTVIADVPLDCPAATEELFGPVAAVFRVSDEREAVRLANASAYGLGAAVFTRDPARGRRLAARLDAGAVFVNGMVRSDPRVPFGGVKASGFGRELGREGLLEFVNAQTVWIDPPG